MIEQVCILIAVKTYPVFSQKYIELVCTAGFREDGSWIRLYPAPFRFLRDDQRYSKYQWIELTVKKNGADSRPESYIPVNIDNIRVRKTVGTEHNWAERKRLILQKNKVYTDLSEIIRGAHGNEFSLVIFKPSKIIDFKVEQVERHRDATMQQVIQASRDQGSLFDEFSKEGFLPVRKLPYKFSYVIEDCHGTRSRMMIEDWEIGQLYWNCFKRIMMRTQRQIRFGKSILQISHRLKTYICFWAPPISFILRGLEIHT
ncbi:MAG: hypothetical protein OXE94_05875 [Aestuariivita sp.]|nr:hypothetical protein [Aestuariivita sp.]MCY4201498.1 hypothetical protein [Aestuariivita sp.]